MTDYTIRDFYEHYTNMNCIQFSPNGEQIAMTDYNGYLSVMNVETKEMIFHKKIVERTHDRILELNIVYSHDINLIAIVNENKTITIVDTKTHQLKTVFNSTKPGRHIIGPIFTMNNQSIIFSTSNNYVSILDLGDGKINRKFHNKSDITDIFYSIENNIIVTCNINGYLRIFDFTTGELLRSIKVSTDVGFLDVRTIENDLSTRLKLAMETH